MVSGIASPAGLACSGAGSVTVTVSPELTLAAGSRIVRASIDRDLAVEDQRLQARARQRRDARGQHAVEPLACLLGGDLDCLDCLISHGLSFVPD